MALDDVAQLNVDVVKAGLNTENDWLGVTEEGAVDRSRCAGAGVDAIVVLVKLIAVDRIVGVPG